MPHFTRSILFLGILLLGACSEKLEPTPFTYSNIFTGQTKKSWRLTQLTIWEEGKPDITITESQLPQALGGACIADDLYTFSANAERTFEVLEGATKCNPNDPDVYLTDTWSYASGNATLTFLFPVLADFPLPFIVLRATPSEMEVEIFLNESNSESYRMVFRAGNN